jgi:hypothetical protein
MRPKRSDYFTIAGERLSKYQPKSLAKFAREPFRRRLPQLLVLRQSPCLLQPQVFSRLDAVTFFMVRYKRFKLMRRLW